MKIEKISKKKNGLYEVFLDNKTSINLYDDIILKYELLLKKEIDNAKLTKLLKENTYLESYHKALKFINVKLRTSSEIKNKLKDYDTDVINYTIDRLTKEKLLNNELYIKAYVNDAINLKLIGPYKIKMELKKLGFKEDEINNYLDTIELNVWYDKIRKYVKKKININSNLSSKMLKLKIINDLQNKGFSKDNIMDIIDEFSFCDNKDVYEKEYLKLKNKLSKKYDGDELEFQIRIKMYQKGFKVEE